MLTQSADAQAILAVLCPIRQDSHEQRYREQRYVVETSAAYDRGVASAQAWADDLIKAYMRRGT